MSQHLLTATIGDRHVEVITGFDRPLQQFFLNVTDASSPDEEQLIHASLHEPWRDWMALTTLEESFEKLGLQAPASLLAELRQDAAVNAGNRIVRHHAGGRLETLHPG